MERKKKISEVGERIVPPEEPIEAQDDIITKPFDDTQVIIVEIEGIEVKRISADNAILEECCGQMIVKRNLSPVPTNLHEPIKNIMTPSRSKKLTRERDERKVQQVMKDEDNLNNKKFSRDNRKCLKFSYELLRK